MLLSITYDSKQGHASEVADGHKERKDRRHCLLRVHAEWLRVGAVGYTKRSPQHRRCLRDALHEHASFVCS